MFAVISAPAFTTFLLQVLRVLHHDVVTHLFEAMHEASEDEEHSNPPTPTYRALEGSQNVLSLELACHLPQEILKSWIAFKGPDLNLQDMEALSVTEWADVVAALLCLDDHFVSGVHLSYPGRRDSGFSSFKTALLQPARSIHNARQIRDDITASCESFAIEHYWHTFFTNLVRLTAYCKGLKNLTLYFPPNCLKDLVYLHKALAPMAETLTELALVAGAILHARLSSVAVCHLTRRTQGPHCASHESGGLGD
jgi:hypothetical protein